MPVMRVSAGALDVWTEPIGMKKSRPGVMLRVLCRAEDREETVRLLFRTLGVRETVCRRYVLDRTVTEIETAWGPCMSSMPPATAWNGARWNMRTWRGLPGSGE